MLLLLLLLAAAAEAEAPFDHSAQHCHDVSIWGEVKFRDMECQRCEAHFEKVRNANRRKRDGPELYLFL